MNWAQVNRQAHLKQSTAREEQYEADLHKKRIGHALPGESELAVALWLYNGTDPVLKELKQQSLATGGKLTLRQIKAGQIALEALRVEIDEHRNNRPAKGHNHYPITPSPERSLTRRELLAKLGLDQEAEQLAKLLRRYTGTDAFLQSVRQQAERGGAGWLPSPAQMDCLQGARLSTELSLHARNETTRPTGTPKSQP